MDRKVLAKWLFEHRSELPAQMFYAGWENEIKASPHTERVYLALADKINQLYEPQPELESDPEFIGEELLKEASQPDQSSRLLTEKEQEIWQAGCEVGKEFATINLPALLKEERDLTASIKDAEIWKLERALIDANFKVHTKKSDSDARIGALIEACIFAEYLLREKTWNLDEEQSKALELLQKVLATKPKDGKVQEKG